MRALSRTHPKNLAVVLIDLQRGYCDPASDAAQCLGWDVTDAERVCRDHGGFLAALRRVLPPERIIWLRMEEAEASYAPNTAYGAVHEAFVPLCVRGTPGHDYHIVRPAAGEPEFLKFHNSGFNCKEFRDYLTAQGITQLAFTGVVASRCVNATVVTASALGYECIWLSDLISGPSQHQIEMREHERLTTFFYAYPMRSAELITRLSA